MAGSRRPKPQAALDLTPFVGVLLVLLITFMAVVPTVLPNLQLSFLYGDDGPPRVGNPVFISLRSNGIIHVGTSSSQETKADWSTLPAVLHAITGGNKRRQILVRADQDVSYADVMRLLDQLNSQGYSNRNLVTEAVE